MLEPLPTRSITRFLLPLADVMALLFSLFLLLPHLQQHPGRLTAPAIRAGSYWTPDEQERVREELVRLHRLTQLPVNQRLSIVVLDIDGDTGDLLLQQGLQQVRVTGTMVDDVIQKHLAAARSAEKELFYLLRVPQPGPEGTKPHPDLRDERRYREWFGKAKVDYRIDYLRLPD
jgi:hypothetical protein